MRCALVGNYGNGNLGDEALRMFFEKRFSTVEWMVLTKHPSKEKERAFFPSGIRSLFSRHAWKSVADFRTCDALVFGGGSLLTDGESLRACWIWFVHARIAHFLGKPVILAFQGVGPFRSRVGAWLARNVCRCAAAISVRDQGSRTILDSWNLTIPVVNTFDPVFSLLQSATNTIAKDGVSIVPRFNIDRSFPDRAKKFCADHAAEKVRILLLEPSHEGVIGEMLRQELTSFHPSIAEIHDLEELCTQLSTSSALLTARYHGGVAALAMGIPFETVRQMSGDKLSSLVALHDVPCEELLRRIDDGVRSLEEALRRASPTLSR